MLAGSHRNAWPDETGTGGRTNRNTHLPLSIFDTSDLPPVSCLKRTLRKALLIYQQPQLGSA